MVSSQLERLFVDGRGDHRVQLTRETELGSGLDELRGGAATLRLFTAHLDRAGNIIQVVNDWRVLFEGDWGAGVYTIKPTAQAEDPGPMRQILGVTDNHRRACGEDFCFQRGIERH